MLTQLSKQGLLYPEGLSALFQTLKLGTMPGVTKFSLLEGGEHVYHNGNDVIRVSAYLLGELCCKGRC